MILVTGAGGTVGRHVVEGLSAAGAEFRVGYSTADKARAAGAQGVDAVVCNFAVAGSLLAAMKGCDHLFLLSGGQRNQTDLETNAVHAAQDVGVQHIVKLSVWGAESEAFSFAKLHRPVERLIETSGLGWTFLRPNGFMQNMVTYYGAVIKTQNAFYIPAGDAVISHIDVRDLAAVAVKALTEPGHMGRAYTLSGPEGLTYAQIAEKISAYLGRTVSYVAVPDDAARAGMIEAGIPDWYADWLVDLSRAYREGNASQVTSTVRDILGRAPRSFDDFLRDEGAGLR